jgi:hypothetical protein
MAVETSVPPLRFNNVGWEKRLWQCFRESIANHRYHLSFGSYRTGWVLFFKLDDTRLMGGEEQILIRGRVTPRISFVVRR